MATKETWFEFKVEVKKAHWQKRYTNEQIELLSRDPWNIMVKISQLEDQVAVSQAKFLYYSAITQNQAKPSANIEKLRVNVYQLINA